MGTIQVGISICECVILHWKKESKGDTGMRIIMYGNSHGSSFAYLLISVDKRQTPYTQLVFSNSLLTIAFIIRTRKITDI